MNINWHDITFCINRLVDSLQSTEFLPSAIIGIGRGGLIPATLIAYKLNVREVHNYSVQSYSDNKSRSTEFTTIQEPGDIISRSTNKNILLVDDLADYGATFMHVRDSLINKYTDLNFRTAAICIKDHTSYVPDYYVTVYPKSEWIIFPWD